MNHVNTKVFLVDNHPVVLLALRSRLAHQRSVSVVGEAGDATEALRKLKRVSPDVIVIEPDLPGLDGGEFARRLRQKIPRAKIIAYSAHADQEYVVRMAHCGAHGYVTKDKPTAKIVETILHVHRGGLEFPPNMVDAILAPGSKPPSNGANEVVLTQREREVLILLAEGLANREVARTLSISVRTTETHREHLTHKLGIFTVAGLVKYAIQHELTSLGPPPVKIGANVSK